MPAAVKYESDKEKESNKFTRPWFVEKVEFYPNIIYFVKPHVYPLRIFKNFFLN